MEITPSPLSAPSSGGGGEPPARRRNDCTACEVRRGRRWRKNGRCGEKEKCGVDSLRRARSPPPTPCPRRRRRGGRGTGGGHGLARPLARRASDSKPLLTAGSSLFPSIPPAGITAGGIEGKMREHRGAGASTTARVSRGRARDPRAAVACAHGGRTLIARGSGRG